MKADFGIADMKFYCAKMNSASVGINPYYLNVNNNIDAMAGAGEIEAAISAEGVALEDGQHYSSAGYDELAQRFFDAINP
jgi:hypothetical protein